MPSESLAQVCLRKGAELFAVDDFVRACAFLAAGVRFDRVGEAPPYLSALAARLSQLTSAAIAAGDFASAQRHDDLLRIFLPPGAPGIPAEQATARAIVRLEDVRRSYAAGDLAAAAAHCLAAEALAPHLEELPAERRRIHDELTETHGFDPNGAPPESALLCFALAARLEETGFTLVTLAEWRRQAEDFAMALELARRAIEIPLSTEEQIKAEFAALASQLRLEGCSAEEAERRAGEASARALRSLGPPMGLSTELLVARVQRAYLNPGVSVALRDLREIMGREAAPQPHRQYAASLVLCCLRNALYPENQPAMDIMAAGAPDSAESLLPLFYSAWTSGAVASALHLAERLKQWYPAFEIMAPLHEMATNHDLTPAASFGEARPGGRRVYATVACWGEAYIALMEVTMIASLLAPNNFPALAERATIDLELFTLERDVERLANSPALRRLGEYCAVKIFAFPEAVSVHKGELPFMLLGFGAHATALRAERDGADFMHICADMIFADGSYAAVARRLTSEPLLLLNDNLNAYAQPVLERLKPCFDELILNASIPQLLSAASGALSKRSLDQIYRPDDVETPYYPVKTIFQVPGGLAMHSFYSNPIYVSHAALSPIVMTNFAPPDGVFIEHLLRNARRGRIEMLVAEEFLGLEVCKDDGHVFDIQPHSLLKSIKDVFFSTGIPVIRKLIFPHRNFFAGVEVDVSRQIEFSHADQVVRSVLEMFETDPLLSDLEKEAEAIDRVYRDAWARADQKTASRSY